MAYQKIWRKKRPSIFLLFGLIGCFIIKIYITDIHSSTLQLNLPHEHIGALIAPIDIRSLDSPPTKSPINAEIRPDSIVIYRVYALHNVIETVLTLLGVAECIKDDPHKINAEIRTEEGETIKLQEKGMVIVNCPGLWKWKVAKQCTWAGHIWRFRIQQHPISLAISATSNVSANVSVPGIEITDIHHRVLSATPEVELMVCVGNPLYFYTNWIQLVQFLEIWRRLGASKVIVPVASIRVEVKTVLQAYENEGFVEIWHWGALPSASEAFSASTRLRNYEQSLLGTACSYHTIGKARFLALVDTDEVLIPDDSLDVPKYLASLLNLNPMAGSFVFQRFKTLYPESFHFPNELQPQNVNFEHLSNLRVETKAEAHGKSVVLPNRVIRSDVHLTEEHRKGYQRFKVPGNRVKVYHFREQKDKKSSGLRSLEDRQLKSVEKDISIRYQNAAKRMQIRNMTTGVDQFIKFYSCKKEMTDNQKCIPHFCLEDVIRDERDAWMLYNVSFVAVL